MDVGDVSLTRVRIAQPVAGVTRIVLDTKGGSNFSVSMESNPYRLVVELRGSEKALAANQFAPTRHNSEIAVRLRGPSAVPAELSACGHIGGEARRPSFCRPRPENFASCSTPDTAAGTWARLGAKD